MGEAMAGAATGRAIAEGHTLCGSTESRTKTSAAGSEIKRLDLGGDVAARRQESCHAPRPAVLPGGQAEVGEGDQEEPLKGQEEEDGGSGGGGGGFYEGGSTPHPRGVAPPSGVVQGGSRPPPTTRLRYAQAGNGGAGNTVQPGTPPRETPSRSQSNLLRVSTRRDPRYCQADRRRLGKEIGKSLSRDRKRRAEEAGAAVEDLMKADPPLIQEAWHRLQGWYKAVVDRPYWVHPCRRRGGIRGDGSDGR